jgi:hypothetical protein
VPWIIIHHAAAAGRRLFKCMKDHFRPPAVFTEFKPVPQLFLMPSSSSTIFFFLLKKKRAMRPQHLGHIRRIGCGRQGWHWPGAGELKQGERRRAIERSRQSKAKNCTCTESCD